MSHLPQVVQNEGVKKKRARPKKAVFVELPLTLDEGTAKYLPYSRVSFPRLTAPGGIKSAMQAKSELESMWVVGMLDHQRQIQLKDGLKDIQHFLSMPEGRILPGAVEELWNVYKNKARPGSAEQRKRGIYVRDGKPLTKGEIRRVMGQSAMAAKLSDQDLIRLEQLEKGPSHSNWTKKDLAKTLNGTVYKRENKKLRRAIRERRPTIRETRVRSKAMETLFEIERRQVVAAIRVQRQWKRYLRLKFWKLYLIKCAAAVRIQKIIRGTVVREFVRRWYQRKTFLVTLSNAIARGALARKHWRIQKALEYLASIMIQKTSRGWSARRRRERVERHSAAENIQRVWRGVVARARADRMWLNRQVMLIQRIVRGHLGRTKHVHVVGRVDAAIRLLQRVYRGMLGRHVRSAKLWERETAERTALVTMLRNEDEYLSTLVAEQRKRVAMGDFEAKERRWRQNLDKARDNVCVFLFSLLFFFFFFFFSLSLFFLFIVLGANFCCCRLLSFVVVCCRLLSLLSHFPLLPPSSPPSSSSSFFFLLLLLLLPLPLPLPSSSPSLPLHNRYGCEFDYLGFLDERRAVSPRAIRQGFTDALDDNVHDWRKRVTRAKVECLFEAELTLRQTEEARKREMDKQEKIEVRFQQVQEQRQWALTSLWRRNSERKWQEETREKQVRVASQKRKWRINFFTKTGKPDKQRRAGHPWEDGAFADASHDTFFLGGADLMLGRKGEKPGRLGSEKALQTALAAVHLQSTQNTMVQYGSVRLSFFF